MNKSPVALLAAVIAAAIMFASNAEAGIRIRLGFGGPLPVFTAHGNGGGGYYERRHYHRHRYIARRVKKEKTYVAKRNAEPKVAKRDTEPKVAKSTKSTPKRESVAAAEPKVTADSENSSITTASLDPSSAASTETAAPIAKVAAKQEEIAPQAPEQKPAKAASKLDCKKFFPSVGMTLTVPCE